MPIIREVSSPPLRHKVLTTDAAGWKKEDSSQTRVGMGCVGIDEEGEIFFTSQQFWESNSSKTFIDSEAKFLGCKTTTLEFAGILIPFMSCPELLMNQTIVVKVDNIGCHFAWETGYSRTDNLASILVRTLVLISELLSSVIIIDNQPRDTTWEIKLADRLSREKTTTSQDRSMLRSFKGNKLPNTFQE